MSLSKKIKEGNRPFIIAGPCSAESEQQTISVCQEIAKNNSAQMLRAGIWKPRTRPGCFEGVGEEGLEWIVNAGKLTNLPTTIEVAKRSHVELALKAGISSLWIGARTTVNPFAVQEIADALKGVNIPVMIKNPVNPDLSLWLGAFERFEKVGITDLTAIHRGFSVYNHRKYRNVPSWELPIALKEKRSQTPIICDPSHISGKRELLFEVSQKAMDLNFDGLMIETHPDPDNAWSDSNQQVTPAGLKEILDAIIFRSQQVSTDVASQIDEIREKVGDVDDQLFELLYERMKFSEQVGQLKRDNNITILQEEHWTKIINNRLNNSDEYRLTPVFVRQFMDAIHQESIRHQTAIMNPKKKGVMMQKVTNSQLSGDISIPASKSDAQRAILCAALSSEISVIHNVGKSNDVKAMLKNVQLLGAKVDFLDNKVQIEGVNSIPEQVALNVGESGLGLRLLVGILASQFGEQSITGQGSIMRREQSFFCENLINNGVDIITNHNYLPITIKGKLKGGRITVDGSQSSQYISGLLMGLPLLENDTLLLVENPVSIPYIDMTLTTLKSFGIEIIHENYTSYSIKGGQKYHSCNYFVESDWSSASYWIVAAALSDNLTLLGLNLQSKQADRAILYALELANCEVDHVDDDLTVNGSFKFPFEFDATHCPDLFPALVVLAAFCFGNSKIRGLNRLVNKESNRGLVLQKEFGKLGIQIDLEGDEMIIHGGQLLHSAEVDSHNDHRIAMALAIVGTKTKGGITINNAEAVAKSYPEFWTDLDALSSQF